MNKNKWRLSGITTFSVEDGERVSTLIETMIPPTSGNRTDILTRCGKYYFGKTKEEFLERMSKNDYLDKIMPIIKFDNNEERKIFEKLRKRALKKMTWTPRKTFEEIAVIIEIKKGEITLKGK